MYVKGRVIYYQVCVLGGGGWVGVGAVTFSRDVQKHLRPPPPPIPLEKKSRPP